MEHLIIPHRRTGSLVVLILLLSLMGVHAIDLFGTRGSKATRRGEPVEFIILSGGPACRNWENYRVEQARHDRWWGNFVRTARVRMEQIRAQEGPDAVITWLVYRTGYEQRAKEDKADLIGNILSVRDKETIQCRLVWFRKREEVIRYLNYGDTEVPRSHFKIGSFDYFGHSNKYAFTFDYSGEVLGASKVFLHQDDLAKLQKGIFARGARNQSWGCHTAESMSKVWRQATGSRLIGAVGKTDYSYCWQNGGSLPIISKSGGKWVR
ncbi:MAG: hypothetical protein AAF191_12660 [Verrucomicrobiota bacterium]